MIKYSAAMKKNFHFQKLFDDQENYRCYMKKRYKIVNTVIQNIKIVCLEREEITYNA